MTETVCPRCLFPFALPKPHGTNPRWVLKNPKPSAVKILRALRALNATSESSAIPRQRVAAYLLGQGENYKAQNITSRASELVTLGLAELVRGAVRETVGGIIKERPKPLWFLTPAGLAYLERGEQAPLKAVAA